VVFDSDDSENITVAQSVYFSDFLCAAVFVLIYFLAQLAELTK